MPEFRRCPECGHALPENAPLGLCPACLLEQGLAADATGPPPESDADPTVSTHRPALREGVGSKIGPYKLLQKIGEGGMGAVFMAEQEHPVRRKVALKVIKPGMDTGQVIARFEAERQALAMMDHTNIARVLDVGATETGLPYFVMELVKGVPITEYCDRNHLTPKERLELFIPVCQAIQHAHQKGIIHRDIKPSNVLVTLHDGKPLPKVIDFGVAKAIDQRLTERTMFTEFGAIIGTLEYMSPEQAEMGALDIDTRSDIYSLGVLLYELLTGSTPLERAKLRKAAYAEIIRRIREEEPTKPSTRLSESNDAMPSISAHRKMEPARLTKLVRGDLDWIVMKSLEKDRTRRYETANGFARDVQRYLDGDAVEACPPSATYKLRKFARKHRVALTTAGAFAVLLVAATAVSIGLALWANRERVRAVKAEKRAEDREEMAIEAMRRFGDVVRETPELKNNPALAQLRATLLKEPQAFFKNLRDRLQADRGTTRESLSRLAAVSFDLGRLTYEIGDRQDALHEFEESLLIRERLADEAPSVIRFQSDLAESYGNIGVLQSETGRPAEALASYEKTLAIFQRLARENSSVARFQGDLASSHNNIGNLQFALGRPLEALESYEQARTIRERLARSNPLNPEFQGALAASHNNIGYAQSRTGRATEALASYERARVIWEQLARENPSVAEFRHGMATSQGNLGLLQSATHRPAEALTSFGQALAIYGQLAREQPSVTAFQENLALNHHNIGIVHSDQGRPAAALVSFEQALPIRERLARERPTVTEFQSDLGASHNDIGDTLRVMGRPAEAMASLGLALAIRERLAREHPESPAYSRDVGATSSIMARVDLNQLHFEAAQSKITRAIEWQRKAMAGNPREPAYRQLLAQHLKILVRASEGLGRADEADRARSELAELVAGDPAKEVLDARLDAVLKGQVPKDDAERIQLAYRAHEKALHASSARLFAEALANSPKLADDRQAQHRYNAACVAILAATSQAKDDPPRDDAAKTKLRGQAFGWLRAEWKAWNRVAMTVGAGNKAMVAKTLSHWKQDADLAPIRDAQELAKLPEDERKAWQALWADVDSLLRRTEGK